MSVVKHFALKQITLSIPLVLLPPAKEVCEGYAFTPVCQSFCSQWGGWYPSMHCRSPGPHPGGSWGVWPGGSPGPHPGGGYPSMHRGKHPPCSRWLLLRAVRILLECIHVKSRNMDPVAFSPQKMQKSCKTWPTTKVISYSADEVYLKWALCIFKWK